MSWFDSIADEVIIFASYIIAFALLFFAAAIIIQVLFFIVKHDSE